MKTLIGIISGLIITILGTYYAYYLNSEKADVRYSLSDPISTKLLSERTNESIQQLEIQNIGNSEAKEIRVYIAAKIEDYELKKYSKADLTKEYKGKEYLEIIYPSLPPTGNFRLLLKSVGGLKNWNLKISHSKGKAEEIFAKSSLSSIIALAVVILWILILIVILSGATIASSIDHLERNARWSPDEILKRNRPFYMIDKGKWLAIRKEAIEHYCEKNYGPIDKSAAYSILSINRPEYLSDEEWILIKNKAVGYVSDRLSENSQRELYRSQAILQLMATPKPINFPDTEWNKIVKEMGKIYILLLKKEIDRFSPQSFVSALKMNKPKEVADDLWTEYIQYIKNEYYRSLSHLLKSEMNPFKVLEKNDLNFLNADDLNRLKKQAYAFERSKLPDVQNLSGAEKFIRSDKPEWIAEQDYELLLKQANKTINLEFETQRYKSLLSLLEAIISKRPLNKDKPTAIAEQEWTRLTELDKEIRELSDENRTKQMNLTRDLEETNKLKNRILKQLTTIDNIFKDPTSLDRIEEYDMNFAPGNWDNLMKLARMLTGPSKQPSV